MSADLERKENCMYKNLSTEKDCVCVHVLGHVRFFVTPWTIARQVPLSMGFSRQECWSGLSFLSPGDLPYPRIKPVSPVTPALTGRLSLSHINKKPSINKIQSIKPEHLSKARVANILFCCLQIWFLNLTHLLFV